MNNMENILMLVALVLMVEVLILFVALIIYLPMVYIIIKKQKKAKSNQSESESPQVEEKENVPVTSNNFVTIWSCYFEQQARLLKDIKPVIDGLLEENKGAKINKRSKKKKTETPAKDQENGVADTTKENTPSSTVDCDSAPNDKKIKWEEFIDRQNVLLNQFNVVFDNAELYFKRMIEPLDCSNEEEKRTGIWAQIDRYKWTSAGLSQVKDISDKLLKCQEKSEYYELSKALSRIMMSYSDVITKEKKEREGA